MRRRRPDSVSALRSAGGRNPALMEPLAIDRICIVREMTIDAFHARLSGTAALYHRWSAS